jgi:hypothetical protein
MEDGVMGKVTFHKTRATLGRYCAENKTGHNIPAAWEARLGKEVISAFDGDSYSAHTEIFGKSALVFGYRNWRAQVLKAHEKIEMDKLAEQAVLPTDKEG